MQLKAALSASSNLVLDNENQNQNQPPLMASQIVQRDGWVTIVRENQVMKVSMERLRSRVGELEQEFNRMKEEMKRVSRTTTTHNNTFLESNWFVSRTFGKCKLNPRSSNVQEDVVESTGPATPRGSVDQPRVSHHSKHR